MTISISDQQADRLITAIEKLSSGGVTPTGFEALNIALTGYGSKPGQPADNSIADALAEIASAINHLAEVIDTVGAAHLKDK